MTWVILIWTAIFVVWTIAGISDRGSQDCAPHDSLCQNASDTGTGIGVALIWMLWFVGFVVLSIIWFMTRLRGERQCPVCGSTVKRGQTSCPRCGYDFRAGLVPQAAGGQPSQPMERHPDPAAVASPPFAERVTDEPGRPEPRPRFDPQTGEPLARKRRFDPYTGEPVEHD
jgi:hypothetical protein